MFNRRFFIGALALSTALSLSPLLASAMSPEIYSQQAIAANPQ